MVNANGNSGRLQLFNRGVELSLLPIIRRVIRGIRTGQVGKCAGDVDDGITTCCAQFLQRVIPLIGRDPRTAQARIHHHRHTRRDKLPVLLEALALSRFVDNGPDVRQRRNAQVDPVIQGCFDRDVVVGVPDPGQNGC